MNFISFKLILSILAINAICLSASGKGANTITCAGGFPEGVGLKYQRRAGNFYFGLMPGLSNLIVTKIASVNAEKYWPSINMGYYVFNLSHADIGVDFTTNIIYQKQFDEYSAIKGYSKQEKHTWQGFSLRPTTMLTFSHFILQFHLGLCYELTYRYSIINENGDERKETDVEHKTFKFAGALALGVSF